MIFFTTLSPTHAAFDQQKKCLESISKHFTVYCINSQNDIRLLSNNFQHLNNVLFVISDKTMNHIFNKEYIALDYFIETVNRVCQSNDIVAFINSDIILTDNVNKLKRLEQLANESLCLVSRYNYNDDINSNTIERFGLDIFVFRAEWLKYVEGSNFTIGKPLWDYYLPYCMIRNGSIKITSIHDKIAFHKNHTKQWNKEDWRKMAVDFRRFDELKNVEERRLSPTIRTTIINNICQTIQNL